MKTNLLAFLMTLLATSAALLTPPTAAAQNTPYGSCPERAQTYQLRYERDGQTRDLICYQKALDREMNNHQRFHCPRTAQHYQTAYERDGRTNDLICYQQALEREMR